MENESRNPKISVYALIVQLTFLHYSSSAMLPTQPDTGCICSVDRYCIL